MNRATIIILIIFASAAWAAVWVGYEGGLRQYTDEGELVRNYDSYRRPISLRLDTERGRLWFLDAYDYTLVCFDVEADREAFRIRNAAHAPAIGTSDHRLYRLEKRPIEPSIALGPGDGSVWVADYYGHQVAKYDADGKEVFRSSAFHEPFAVAALADCSAWVSGGISTLTLVGPECQSKQTMSGVNEARALAYDAARELVWVADYRNNRVFAMNSEGRLKRRVTGIEMPAQLSVDDARGNVWVATHYAGIVKISADAEKIAGSIPEPESVAALDVDGDGRLWVAYDQTEEIVCYSTLTDKVLTIKRVNLPTGVAAE
jgi:DNA-binding beta-propeller fold protein YncE